MQRVKYINPNGQVVEFCDKPPFIFEKILGIGMPDTRLYNPDSVGLNGGLFDGLNLEPRRISLNFHIKGESRGDLYRNRRKLISYTSSLLNADGVLGRLEYTNEDKMHWIPCVPIQGGDAQNRIKNYNISVPIHFYCPDPLWRDMHKFNQFMAYIGGGMKFPVNIPINEGIRFGQRAYKAIVNNSGNAPTPIEITITAPALQPEIIKTRTGEYIRLKKAIHGKDKLVIDTYSHNLKAVIIHEDGTEEDAMGYIEPDSRFFELDPGDNVLDFKSGDDSTKSTIIIEGYPRCLGV